MISTQAFALEGNRIHYSSIGTLGSGIASSDELTRSGFFGTLQVASGSIYGVNFGDGTSTASTSVSNIPLGVAALGTVSGNVNVNTNISQKVSAVNLVGGYSFRERFFGGNFTTSALIPYIDITRTSNMSLSSVSGFTCSTPAILVSIGSSCSIAANSTAQKYITNLNTANNASDSGVGDVVLEGKWSKNIGHISYILGLGITTPTGSNSASTPVNVGFGYWSFTPTAGVIYNHPKFAFAGKISYQHNSTNPNSTYTSGKVIITELGVFGKDPRLGLLGINAIQVNQVTDDVLGTPTSLSGYIYSVGTPNSDGNRMRYLTIAPFYGYLFSDNKSMLSVTYTWQSVAVYSQLANILAIRYSKKFE